MKTFFYPESMVIVGVSLTKINLGDKVASPAS